MATYLICPTCRRQYLHGTGCPCRPPKRAGSTGAWKRARKAALERDGYRCTALIDNVQCASLAVEVHHVRSYATGGSDELTNLASVCHEHHVALRRARLGP